MGRALLIVGLALATAPAAADPLAVQVGLGMRAQRRPLTQGKLIGGGDVRDRDEPAHYDVYPAISVALGYRLPIESSVGVAIGVHAAMSRIRWEHRAYISRGEDDVEVFRDYPLDLAVATQLSRGRWWLAPWFGVQRTRETHWSYSVPTGEPIPASGGHEQSSETTSELALGIGVGFDVLRTRGGNLGLLLDTQASSSAYTAIGLGVAYRR